MNAAPRELLRAMFDAAVAAAQPSICVPANLPSHAHRRTVVLGAGKASAAMAKAVEDHWPGPIEGIVVTAYGHGVSCKRIEIVEAAHPVPDEQGLNAARRMLTAVDGLTEDDLVLAFVSGGGSALLTVPAAGLSLGDRQAVNRALLASGATISEMNCVRNHLSAIKGGRLAAAALPARVITLLISDVPGDDPSIISSGPTVSDRSTFVEAQEILRKYGITEPSSAVSYLDQGREETPKPGDVRLA